jgi:hypothetical protein
MKGTVNTVQVTDVNGYNGTCAERKKRKDKEIKMEIENGKSKKEEKLKLRKKELK